MKHPIFLAALVGALAAPGCSERSTPAPAPAPAAAAAPAAAPPQAPASTPAAAPTDRWLGQWNGPEGTFLKLAGGQGSYEVTVRNLDGPRTFAGRAVEGGIQFERDGTKETLRATKGAETGMKWLADKSDCLTVRSGEGYCRD